MVNSADIYLAAKKGLVEYRQIFLPTPNDVDPAEFHYDWSRELLGGESHAAFEGFRESGKALDIDTDIPTTNGFKKMSDIGIGDKVFDSNGDICNVINVSEIFFGHRCFEVCFSDGTSVIADEEHLWIVNDKKKRRKNILTTKEMFNDFGGWNHVNGYKERRFTVDVCGKVKYDNKIQLEDVHKKRSKKICGDGNHHPYLIGLWLGDGTSESGVITIGKQDQKYILNKISSLNYDIRVRSDGDSFGIGNGFHTFLRKMNMLNNKHIPEMYKQSTVEERVELINGLIDSDGTVAKTETKKGVVTFGVCNKRLAEDFLEVIRSLGYKASIRNRMAKLYGKSCKIEYMVDFKADKEDFKFLSRKQNLLENRFGRSKSIIVTEIKEVQTVPTKCISVDSKDKTYLYGREYHITHNSSIILRAFPLYALTFPSEQWRYIVFLKSNQAQARKALKGITSEFMNNPFINARLSKVLKNTADVFEVELDSFGVKYPVLIEAYGKGASIRGLSNKDIRPTIIVGDDLQDSADMNSETVPDNDWEWFLGDVMFLGQSARIFLIGNNLGERCIIERVSTNAKALGFKFKRIPCANGEMTESAWPSKYTIADIKKEREDYESVGELDVWLREKMCVSVNDETRVFKEGDFRHYTPSLADMICDRGTVFATLDPASSKEQKSCFRAICINAVMPDGHWYILEMPYGRWDANELIDKMFEMVRKWGFRDFGIEKGQLQQFLEPILYSEMTRRDLRFNIIPLEHGKIGSKLERIKMLQPRFKCHSVWFPDTAYWLDELKSELAGVTRTEIKSMMIDLVDCMAMQNQMVTIPMAKDNKHGRMNKNLQLEAVR